jgi:hypothetical protein
MFGYAGVIYINDGTNTLIQDCLFNNSIVGNGDGGAMIYKNAINLTLKACIFQFSVAAIDGNGGTIYQI